MQRSHGMGIMEGNEGLSKEPIEGIRVAGAIGEVHDVEVMLGDARELAKRTGSIIQLLDAHAVYGTDHLLSAALHAKRAWEQGRSTASDLGLEILLYTAGDVQIQRALGKVGVKEGHMALALVVLGPVDMDDVLDALKLVRDDSVLKGDERALDILGIERGEGEDWLPERYEKLVLEKVALVDLLK